MPTRSGADYHLTSGSSRRGRSSGSNTVRLGRTAISRTIGTDFHSESDFTEEDSGLNLSDNEEEESKSRISSRIRSSESSRGRLKKWSSSKLRDSKVSDNEKKIFAKEKERLEKLKKELEEKEKQNRKREEDIDKMEKTLKKSFEEMNKETENVKCGKRKHNDSIMWSTKRQCSADQKEKQMSEMFDTQMTCSICSEYFIQAVNLNCSHTFCLSCIEEWKVSDSNNKCPICRKEMVNQNRELVLDNLIDEFVAKFKPHLVEKRNELIEERKERLEEKVKKNVWRRLDFPNRDSDSDDVSLIGFRYANSQSSGISSASSAPHELPFMSSLLQVFGLILNRN